MLKVKGLKTPKHIKAKRRSPVTGVTVGGKRYTSFSQIKVTPSHKKTPKQRLAGGIKLAIL